MWLLWSVRPTKDPMEQSNKHIALRRYWFEPIRRYFCGPFGVSNVWRGRKQRKTDRPCLLEVVNFCASGFASWQTCNCTFTTTYCLTTTRWPPCCIPRLLINLGLNGTGNICRPMARVINHPNGAANMAVPNRSCLAQTLQTVIYRPIGVVDYRGHWWGGVPDIETSPKADPPKAEGWGERRCGRCWEDENIKHQARVNWCLFHLVILSLLWSIVLELGMHGSVISLRNIVPMPHNFRHISMFSSWLWGLIKCMRIQEVILTSAGGIFFCDVCEVWAKNGHHWHWNLPRWLAACLCLQVSFRGLVV